MTTQQKIDKFDKELEKLNKRPANFKEEIIEISIRQTAIAYNLIALQIKLKLDEYEACGWKEASIWKIKMRNIL